MHNSYPAKLLLFGEYAVICGGEGLAIPDFNYEMHWDSDIRDTNILSSFCAYLENHFELNHAIDTKEFAEDIKNHYYLLSNIPEGYGLGSSGAVVAAIYNKYAVEPLHIKNDIPLNKLRHQLSQMESFFHGESSGLDPLVSLIQKPIHLKSNGEVEVIATKIDLAQHFNIELYDSNITRQTSSIVALFKEKLQDVSFRNSIENNYIPLVSNCIHNTIINNFNQLHEQLLKLSEYQLMNFTFAIPLFMQTKWQAALNSGNEIYKLCGAGGGGFIIRFSLNN